MMEVEPGTVELPGSTLSESGLRTVPGRFLEICHTVRSSGRNLNLIWMRRRH
jgi:hypothetical protein